MRTRLLIVLVAALLTANLSAAPISTVSDEALALGASMERWAQAHGMTDWVLRLFSNQTTEVGQWPLTVTFLVGSSVTKEQVDQAELEFYPWFRKTAPGLVPEAVFERREVWQGTFAPPGVAFGPADNLGGIGLAGQASRAEIEVAHGPGENLVQSVRVTWSWPADLTPPLEADEAAARREQMGRVPAAWTVASLPSAGTGGLAWLDRSAGGSNLAAALEAAYQQTASLIKRGPPPYYSLVVAREGNQGLAIRGNNPWYPDQTFQTLGLVVDVASPPGPVSWNQWAAVRSLWGPDPVEVTYRFRLTFQLAKGTDAAAWRDAAQEDLRDTPWLTDFGWSWGQVGVPEGTEVVELTLRDYSPEVLRTLTEFQHRHQP